jgi:hypothetical protein
MALVTLTLPSAIVVTHKLDPDTKAFLTTLFAPQVTQAQLTAMENRIIMALSTQAQAIVDDINESTNEISTAVAATGSAVTVATAAITDLAAKVAAGTIDPAEFAAAAKPSLDTLKAAAVTMNATAAALTKTATDADPAVNPSAPPIPPVTAPDGETQVP